MKENKLIKFLIPLIAAVVVFESIILVTNLDKNKGVGDKNNSSATESAQIAEEVVENPVMDLIFSTDVKEMKVGKTYKVTLNLLPKEDRKVDGIETYIKYDIEGLKLSNLIPAAGLQKPTISQIDTEKGVIKNIVLIDDKEGLAITDGELLPILTFSVTPKKEGEYSFELSTGNESKDFVTLVVENASAKPLPWVGNKLDVNVIK